MEPNNPKNKKVETYTEDMVRAIQDDRSGLIRKIITEEEAHEAEKINLSPDSKRNKFFTLFGLLLLVVSLGMIIFLFFFNKGPNIVPVMGQHSGYIFCDKNDFQDIKNLNKEKLGSLIYNLLQNSDVSNNKVASYYLIEDNNVIGFQKFVSKMEINIGAQDISRVFNDQFMIGVFNKNENKHPFILLRNNSFQDAFVLMRAWEGKILRDLHLIFGVELSSETNYLFTKDFKDGVVANKNAKILYDEAGNIVFMYVFFDNSFVIITDSIEATNEVVARLASSKIKK